MRWNSSTAYEQTIVQHSAAIGVSIAKVLEPIDKFDKYEMNGSQKATTKVKIKGETAPRAFTTSNQMHSEMAAVDYMLGKGHWQLFLGTVVTPDGDPVAPGDFVTDEPHCGFCTVFLQVLRLPLSKPTRGQFNMASNLNYPVPEAIRKDPMFLSQLLWGEYNAFSKIKKILNNFVRNSSKEWLLEIRSGVLADDYTQVCESEGLHVVKWADLFKEHAEVLERIWKLIFQGILESNREQKMDTSNSNSNSSSAMQAAMASAQARAKSLASEKKEK